MRSHPFVGLGLGLLMLIGSGCGGSNPSATDFHVSGTVQFNGQPLPAGKIYFTPDSSQGNQGPQGVAEISDGKYDTSESRFGVVGGPYIVRIDGYDGVQPADDEDGLFPDGQVVFRDYEVKLTLPEENHVEDIQIPATAGKKK
ncbi:hypothetical protein [Bremerella cremea]|uniref:hypothetical protein n=1 Tax=Bremerella cremea TaxID=1031537 RepID=UPI0031E59B81